MSRSNPTPTNPAKKFFKWSGSKGELVYYDKEKQEEVIVPLPFTFMVLDQLSTITGYSDQDQSGFWSNEVRSVAREELNVKTSKGTKEVGLYRNIKGSIGVVGSKYAKSIYIAYKENDEEGFAIGNIKAYGAALTAWIEFSNKEVVDLGKVTLTGSEEAKKGTTVYHVPTFEWSNAETDEDEVAKELDKELQVYLSQYFANKQTEGHAHTDDDVVTDIDTDEPASNEQRLFISTLMTSLDIPLEDHEGYLNEQFGVDTPLTKEAATFVIGELKDLTKKQPTRTPVK